MQQGGNAGAAPDNASLYPFIPASKTFESLKSKNIEIRIRTRKLVSEEAEWTYKDIDEVVGVVEKADLAVPVSRNVPIAVIKG